MLIYRAEIEAGLKDIVRDNKIVLSSLLKPSQEPPSQQELKLSQAASFDLYTLNTILVTTCWNKNADIFTKEEVWAARKTPEDKPLNINHDHSKIVGHITSCNPITVDGKILSDDLATDEVPDLYHILTSAVLYRALKDNVKELREEVEAIIAEIPKGLWFVSMECLFAGFDYGLDDGKTQRVVARNSDTAFLTKHLRAYGGTGEFEGKKLGRVLRNITFSGKGLVKNPANPYSIIIANEFKPVEGEEMKPEELEKKVTELEDKLDAAKASERQFKNQLAEANEKVESLTKKVTQAESLKTEADEKMDKDKKDKKKLEDEKAALVEQLNTASTKITDLEKKVAESVDMFNKMEKEKKADKRKDAMKDKDKTDAEKVDLLKKFENFDDDTFAAVVNLIPNKASAAVTTTELETKVETAGNKSVEASANEAQLKNDLKAFFKVETK